MRLEHPDKCLRELAKLAPFHRPMAMVHILFLIVMLSLLVISTSCMHGRLPDVSQIRDPRVRDLCAQLTPESPAEVKNIAEELAKSGSREGFACYMDRMVYWAERKPEYAQEFVGAASAFGLQERIDLVAALLPVRNPDMKYQALRMMAEEVARSPNQQITELLLRYTKDRSDDIKDAACAYLPPLSDGSTPGGGSRYCFEEDWGVVFLRLVELSEYPYPNVRMGAVDGLARTGRVAVPFLVARLTDRGIGLFLQFCLCGTWEIRTKAAACLGEIDSPSSLSALKEHLLSTDRLRSLVDADRDALSVEARADLVFAIVCAYSAAKLGDFEALRQLTLLKATPVLHGRPEKQDLAEIWTTDKLRAHAESTPEDRQAVQELLHLLHDPAPKEMVDLKWLNRFVESNSPPPVPVPEADQKKQ